MPPRLAGEFLGACAGCEMALLNLGEPLLDLLDRVEVVHFPLLMDHKYFGPDGAGEGGRLELPPAEVGLVSGGLRTREHREILAAMRRSCKVLIALGTCATHGGIPGLANLSTRAELMERCHRQGPGLEPGPDPDQVVPPLLERVYALDEAVPVDVLLPGCPPHPDHIAMVLEASLAGRPPDLPGKSVCDTCPTVREGKGQVKKVARFTRGARFKAERPLGEMRCLLEQGLTCMGPVTRAGCAGAAGEAPRCIVARVPCRGCHGPVKPRGNQMLDMLNALASNGIASTGAVDRPGWLRFSGAHGRLRPRPVPSKE